MSPVATPTTAPLSSNSTSAAAKPGIDLDAQRLGLGGEPAADIAERDDVVAVVVHQRRHQEIRQPQRARRRRANRSGRRVTVVLIGRVFVAPVRQQPVEADRDRSPRRRGCARRPRSPSRPRPRRDLGRKLLEPDRGREPGRPGADDHHVELHRLAGRQFVGAHRSSGRRSCSADARHRTRSGFRIVAHPWTGNGRSPRDDRSWCYSNSKDIAISSKRYANRW